MAGRREEWERGEWEREEWECRREEAATRNSLP
jgi:hypothetical protein